MKTIILNAGKIPSEMRNLFGDLPSGMIPINGKPSIVWSIKSLYNIGVDSIIMSVGFKKDYTKDLIKRYFSDDIEISFVEVDYRTRPGHSLVQCSKNIDNPFLIVLGDTLITEDVANEIVHHISKNRSFILTSKDFENPSEWCLVRKRDDNIVSDFFEKENINNDVEAVIGVYYISNPKRWLETLGSLRNTDVEISEILREYAKSEKIYSYTTEKWLDIGHLRKYYKAKRSMLSSRVFNYIEVDDRYNILKKRSKNKSKLLQEINWYIKIPSKLKSFIPQIIEIDLIEPYVSMEYMGYPSLSEIYLFSSFDEKVWKTIFSRLFDILDVLRSHKVYVSEDDYKDMYETKTRQRIEMMKNIEGISEFLHLETIEINGKIYENFPTFEDDVYKIIPSLYNEEDNTIIHGDFCFPNILFDVGSNVVKLIDPRGKWGSSDIGGDIKYDVAKLSHSVLGKYDYIVNDLFSLSKTSNGWVLKIHRNKNQERIEEVFIELLSKRYNIWKIRLIEGLLFISMVPLHRDNKKRQIAQYLTGVKILNEVKKHFQ